MPDTDSRVWQLPNGHVLIKNAAVGFTEFHSTAASFADLTYHDLLPEGAAPLTVAE